MIGYVLLITFAIIISIVVYKWLSTYVPKEGIECPDGVQIYVSDYNCSNSTLNLTLRNTGTFNINGTYIYYSTNKSQEIATKDLSLNLSYGGTAFGQEIRFDSYLEPNKNRTLNFNINASKIYLIRILPMRYQIEKNKERLVVCGNGETKQIINYCP